MKRQPPCQIICKTGLIFLDRLTKSRSTFCQAIRAMGAVEVCCEIRGLRKWDVCAAELLSLAGWFEFGCGCGTIGTEGRLEALIPCFTGYVLKKTQDQPLNK